MTLDFYQLKEQPFAASPDPRFLFLSDTHRQALASLLRALQADRGFATLLAQPGLGKTTLLFHILRSFGDKVSTIYIFQAMQAPVDLLRAMLADLGVGEINVNPEGMLSQLKALLNEEHRLGKRVVVVIDEAQNLDTSVFKVLRMLSNLETPRGRLIQFILCGRPMPRERLAAIKPLQWMHGGEPVAHLEPFNAQDTAQYLDHRLRTAGYDRQLPLFTPEAARLVAAYSHGTPRIINTLCSEALSAAYNHRREQIGIDTVREAAATLNLTQLKPESMYARPPQIITMPLISKRRVRQPPALLSNADYVTDLPPQKAPPPPEEAAKTVVVAATMGQPAAPSTLYAWTSGQESEPRVSTSFAPNVAKDLLGRPAEAIPDPLWQSASPEVVATREVEVVDAQAIDLAPSVLAATEVAPAAALTEVVPATSQAHLSATQAVVSVQATLVIPPAPLIAANRRMKKRPKKTVPSKLKPLASPRVVAASSVVDAPIKGPANNVDPAKDVVPEKNVDLPKNVVLFALASKEVARAASQPETSAEEAAVPVQAPPLTLREHLKGVTSDNVIPLRGSQPAVMKSPTRKNGTALWSMVPRPAPGLATAAVLLVFLTGVIFGMYHPRTSPPPVAEAPVLHEPEPTVPRIQTPALIAVEPKATPSATSPAHDLKGMDLESALQALSTKTRRQTQVQPQQSR